METKNNKEEKRPQEKKAEHHIEPDLTWEEVEKGTHPGDTYIRIHRPYARLLRRLAPDYLLATEQVYQPKGPLGRIWSLLHNIVIGPPLPTAAEVYERLGKAKALAIFASDALSSNAYATEEILLVLVLAGSGALGLSLPIALTISLVLAMVAFSYRQTVQVYTKGGGSYTVAKENLGTLPGLVAAAALLIDYVLTVAVSIAAGTAAITSAVPQLYEQRVILSLFFILLITLGNLRGIREAGNIFTLPTYFFIFSMAGMILVGLVQVMTGTLSPTIARESIAGSEPLTLFLILRAFSSGSVAMTGTEAIANGVPAFKPPEGKNAAITLFWMATILAVFFVGLTFLATAYGIVPSETETVVSQLARGVFGGGVPYFIVQASTMFILALAANTSFAGFPRLSYVLALDRFMPHQFSFRGERLAFSNGILILALLAGILIVAFGGSTHALIPLYAVGVFLSFTLSQAGMVVRWWRLRSAGWKRSIAINGSGAFLTGIVLVVVASTKFIHGAWIVLVLIPTFVLMFLGIRLHYRNVAEQLRPSHEAVTLNPATATQKVIVPIADVNQASLRAVTYAKSISEDVIGIHATDDPKEAEVIRKKWREWEWDTPLVILESPYRSLTPPLLTYIEALHQENPEGFITVVVPEFIPVHWWEHFLHNRSADRLRKALLSLPNTVVIDVPYQLKR